MGKGSFLKRAAEHFAEIANKARLHEEEDEKRDLKEAELHVSIPILALSLSLQA